MEDFSLKTRSVYQEQHSKVANDQVAMTRFLSMFNEQYFGVDQGFFQGKKCLDAGCGNTAKLLIALSDMGAASVTGLDLGEDFKSVSLESYKRWAKSPQHLPELVSGSILDLPFEDNQFDFVSCHGVLLHLNTVEEVEMALKELARVTKPGGLLYTVYATYGGLLEEAVFPAIRDYYKRNEVFKAFVDNLDATEVVDDYLTAVQSVKNFDVDLPGLELIAELFDTDLAVTLQNIVQVPVRLPISEEMVLEFYKNSHLGSVRRLSRYIERQNIRKYAAPMHFDYDNPISKAIYGSGSLEFIGIKE